VVLAAGRVAVVISNLILLTPFKIRCFVKRVYRSPDPALMSKIRLWGIRISFTKELLCLRILSVC
jgi:hypothetical protein